LIDIAKYPDGSPYQCLKPGPVFPNEFLCETIVYVIRYSLWKIEGREMEFKIFPIALSLSIILRRVSLKNKGTSG